MSIAVLTKSYPAPRISEREILRYMGAPSNDGIESLICDAIREAEGKISYRVCYVELPLSVSGELCDFGALSVRSRALAKALSGCRRAIIFAATVGVGIDRLIGKYSRISPTAALAYDAFGSERIEALCDSFTEDIRSGCGVAVTPRYSPGYGDLPLDFQRDVFAILDCERRIGLTLCDSLIMTPTKSVTAILGLK